MLNHAFYESYDVQYLNMRQSLLLIFGNTNKSRDIPEHMIDVMNPTFFSLVNSYVTETLSEPRLGLILISDNLMNHKSWGIMSGCSK